MPINQIYTNRGFTLIELMVAITVAAVLASAAVPSFASLIARNKVTTQTNAILESLYLARSYAIVKQRNVHVCHLNAETNSSCSEDRNYKSKWSHGWLVFADNNGDRNFDDKDELLQIVEMPDSVNIVFNQRGRLRFFPDGSARSSGFYVCDRNQQSFKHVYLLHTGRARINQKLSAKQKSTCDKLDSRV